MSSPTANLILCSFFSCQKPAEHFFISPISSMGIQYHACCKEHIVTVNARSVCIYDWKEVSLQEFLTAQILNS